MRGAKDSVKRRAIFDYHRNNADLLILQETHSDSSIEKLWENEWGGRIILSHGTTLSKGVGMFFSKTLFQSVRNIYKDMEGRFVLVDIHQNDMMITLLALYAPNENNAYFFTKINDVLKDRHEHKVIIGDFNCTLNVNLDRHNTYCNNNKAKEEIENIMNHYCLNDVWRVQNPDKKEYSWFKKGQITKASRIDYALVTKGLDQNIKNIMYLSSIKTDHRAIYMVIDLNKTERGKGFWKMNTSLLTNQQYIDCINETIELCKTRERGKNPDPVLEWELLKKRIKETTIEFTKNNVTKDRIIISQLSEKVNEYEERLPLNEEETELWQKTKLELEEKMMTRTKGILFRSKVKWYEEGEKNSRYFFSLEKARYNAKTCFKIIDDQGQEYSETKDILKVQKDFYTTLYAQEKDVKFTLKNNFNIYVPHQIKEQQGVQITYQEIEEAIKTMKNNKTPGQDGIPVDFYKVFWRQIKPLFYDMMLTGYEKEYLHTTARQGILNLIPKANKDTRYVKNLRPITLLNVDYKIIEKCVANKMMPALEHIINKDQRGFMKDRRISVNIRKILDIIQQAKHEDLEAVVLSLDFVKCFDKCSFDILHGSLEFFDFGSIVKEWTKILYRDFSVKIQNNGHFSDNIEIKKGVHQGGCCSSVYFLVIAEILAICLRNNQQIDGITFRDIRNLLNQFADDMDICSIANEDSLREIFKELDVFRQQSGFTISYEKTTLYRIGSLRHSSAQMYNMDQVAWSNEDITVLGVTIAHEDILEKNFTPMIEKVRTVLNAWYNRGLSLVGKIQVVNTLVSSLFVYKMMVLPLMPKHIIKNIENEIRAFIWNKKKAKIALAVLKLPKHQGGLALVDLHKKDKALKTSWPLILYQEEHYSELVYQQMKNTTLKHHIWCCHIHPEDVKQLKIRNTFWEDVLKCWCEYNYYKDNKIENQYLWYNSKVKVGGKIVLWTDCFQKGLMYVHQLFVQNQFKDENLVYNEYGLTKMRYNSIKMAIPREWKHHFQQTPKISFCPVPPHEYDMCINVYKKSSKKVYNYLLDDVMLLHNKYLKWREDLGQDFCQTLYYYVLMHKDIYKVTNVPKYRSFQYRINQRALITNIKLQQWGIVASNLCFFCKEKEETVLHLMWECTEVQSLWTNLWIYVQQRFPNQKFEVNKVNVIFNKLVDNPANIVNFLCLITKQYIYSSKCMKNSLSFSELKMRIGRIENIEKYIATKNETVSKHLSKWSDGCRKENVNLELANFITNYIHDM